MARTSKITDDVLRQYVNLGYTQHEIAGLTKLSQSTVAERLSSIAKRAAAAVPAVIEASHAQLWDVRTVAEENYRRCLQLLEQMEQAPNKLKAVSEIRQHLQLAVEILQKMYDVQETQAFMDEVLAIIDECEPGSRERVLARLRERRTVRAAFYPPSH